MIFNLFQNTWQKIKHHPILKPQHRKSKLLQPICPPVVVFFGGRDAMGLTVKFDDKLFCCAVEIDYEIFYAVLPPEFSSVELFFFKMVPKEGFGWREVAAEVFALGFQFLSVVNLIFIHLNLGLTSPVFTFGKNCPLLEKEGSFV